jgi:hypothetical protein
MKNNFGLPIVNAQSPHEMDFVYIGEMTGQPDLAKFATAAGMAIQEDLTNLARVYKPELFTYIADEIAPRVPVMTEAGRYTALGQEGFDIDVSDALADDASAGTLVWAAEKVSFQIDPRGLQTFVSDRIANSRGPVQAGAIATKLLMQGLMLRQEIRVRNLADATNNAISNGTDWDTSTAVHTDVAAAQAAMQAALGLRGTHIALGDHIADEMVGNPNIQSSIATAAAVADGRKYLGMVTSDGLATVTNPWGLRVVLPNAMYTTTAPGLGRTKARVWGDDGFLVHVDRDTETSGWAVQLEYLAPVIVRWRDETRGVGGYWYKAYYQRKAYQLTPEAIVKLPDLT